MDSPSNPQEPLHPTAGSPGYPPGGPPPFPLPPQKIVVRQTSALFFQILSVVGWLGLILAIGVIFVQQIAYKDYFQSGGEIREKYHSLSTSASDKVAIINVSGIIMQGEGYVKQQIDKVRKDKHVKAIVLRVDSPGGTVTGSDYIYHHLSELRKDRNLPIVVSMGSMAASGGYYVAMAVGDQEKSIYAEPTTTTGSIGVIIPHYDISGLLARYDIKDDSIVSHPRKQMLKMTKEMSPEDREILQRYVDLSFKRFKDIVESGRPAFVQDKEALVKLATGEIFTAEQALENGLVDEIGFIEQAIERAIELAELDPQETRVVHFQRNLSLLDQLAGVQAARSSALDINHLLEMTVPRAYYMSSWQTPLITSRP